MSDIKTSIYGSINSYTNKLTYLAKENKAMVNDLMLLVVLDQVYDWANWMNATQQNLMDLQNFIKSVIRNNPDILNYRTQSNEYYKNVNTPQTIYTWQRLYDKANPTSIITFETI